MVIGTSGSNNPSWRGGKITMACRECGLEFKVFLYRKDSAKFCSALCARRSERTHGMSKSLTYKSWRGMIERCERSSHKDFRHYGGKGVKVCPRWRSSFVNFLEDMGVRPSAGHSLDRIDGNGDYCPSNVKWATTVEQARNRCSNHVVEYCGEKINVSALAERIGVKSFILYSRLRRGWSLSRATETPVIAKPISGKRGLRTDVS
jgi:hypothetical protein